MNRDCRNVVRETLEFSLLVYAPGCSRLRNLLSIWVTRCWMVSVLLLMSEKVCCNWFMTVPVTVCTFSFSWSTVYSSSRALPRASQAVSMHWPVDSSTNGEGPRSRGLYWWALRIGSLTISSTIVKQTTILSVPIFHVPSFKQNKASLIRVSSFFCFFFSS